tara:strand:+ start:466 stop:717 length:252 start_codon:yes stop_codon:yes gene_type:complete
MGKKQSNRSDAHKVLGSHPNFEVGDLVLIKDSLNTLGIISEVKGKMKGANHDWNKYYYMIVPMGSKYPIPVWNKELELVRKAK